MSIIRAPRPVIIVQRSLIEDGRLSWAARGLMVFIDAQPDDWEFSVAYLLDFTVDEAKSFADRHSGICALFAELLDAGYLLEDGRA